MERECEPNDIQMHTCSPGDASVERQERLFRTVVEPEPSGERQREQGHEPKEAGVGRERVEHPGAVAEHPAAVDGRGGPEHANLHRAQRHEGPQRDRHRLERRRQDREDHSGRDPDQLAEIVIDISHAVRRRVNEERPRHGPVSGSGGGQGGARAVRPGDPLGGAAVDADVEAQEHRQACGVVWWGRMSE